MEDEARKELDEMHKKRRRITLQPIAVAKQDRQKIPVPSAIRSIFWDDALQAKMKQDIVERFFDANFGAQLVRSDPPVVYFSSFLDKDTLDDLLRFVNEQWAKLPPEISPQESVEGAKVSKKQQLALGQRTSVSEAFPERKHYILRRIGARARAALGLPLGAKYLEYLQVVRYKEGQKFDLHHDAGTLHIDDKDQSISVDIAKDTLDTPLRSFTIFVYLNDVPERNGGATVFPLAKNERGEPLSVQPRAGAASMWANVTEDGDAAEIRTIHAAEPLRGKKSTKSGMNIWFTFREFSS